mmetsp:Transcript_94439/g.243914  ORF Transcript_94439/g.243914 Transcript_94439/m.243914 type:complete len:800 (+) Transcript_94439:74-2473(+)
MSRKKIRLNQIDVDVDQFALVVSYVTETQHFDQMGNPVGAESVPGQKVIRVQRGLTVPEISSLAQEVVEKCKYIPASRVGEVERLLCALMEHEAMQQQHQHQAYAHQQQHHQQQQQYMGGPYNGDAPPQMAPQRSQGDGGRRRKEEPLLPAADIRHVEDYADQLYEERMELKVQGAKCILRVCMDPAALEIIAEHDTMLGVMSRELRENSKKSFELSIALVSCFLCFSHFSQFHEVMMQHQCGTAVMRVFEYESERHQVRKHDMERRHMRFQELGDQATSDDKKLLAKDEKKYRIQLARQSKLILVCLTTLLNLAEEISVEKKMVNRKMPQLLTQVLDRSNNDDLLLVALQFIKKLSVFEENKDLMSSQVVLSRLVQMVQPTAQSENVRVALLALRVLYNFSFDEALRGQLVESGMVQLLVAHLRSPPFRHIVLRLLYHFSMDDRCRSLMAYQRDGMVMLLQLVVHFPEARVGKDLVALVVNLATHQRAAEVMVGSGLFPQVMLRVLKTRDPLLCKVIRHVSAHQEVCEVMHQLLSEESVRMSKWMHEFVRMAPSCIDNPDFLVEVIGTLANTLNLDVPWGELCEAGLVDLLTRLLMPGFSEDDIVLECVMLAGNMATCREAAQYIASSRLPVILQELLVEKHDDQEIVVQLLYAFQCLLQYEEVRDAVLQETELAACIMRFASIGSQAVLEQASLLLEFVAEHASEVGQDWGEQLKTFRFEQHNAEWCRCIAREMSGGVGMSPGGGYYDDEQGSGNEDEEEFAFHWAGGDAGDAQDLASRDWGNKDAESFMRTSRMVS